MRGLIRAIVVLILLVALVVVGLSYLGYRVALVPAGSTATGGSRSGPGVDSARERGSEIGRKIGEAGSRAEEFLSESAITAKIKSKMALDDHVDASAISVETARGGVVTLSGEVASQDARRRAVELARDTKGVTSVVDHLRVAK